MHTKQRVFRFIDVYPREYILEDRGYEKVSVRDINGKEELYMFKPFFHESPRHGILVFEITEILKGFPRVKVKQYLSLKPDIVFEVNGKTFAIEVETGIILKKNRNQLRSKVNNLKYFYGRNWFFVVTDRNLVKSYKRYGKTYTKRNVFSKIWKIIALS